MKYLLFSIGLLLTMDVYCELDTLELTSQITSVEVQPTGTFISRSTDLNLTHGNYMLYLKDLPSNLLEKNIDFEALEGLGIVNIHLISPLDKLEQHLDIKNLQSISSEISRISKNIKHLDLLEKNLIHLKSKLSGKQLSINEIKTLQKEFQTENVEIKKQRQEAYKELMILREKSADSSGIDFNQLPSTLHSNQSELYIEVIVLDKVHKSLKWNYFISNGLDKIVEEDELEEIPVPKEVELKGKVIEATHGGPIVFATVEFYQDKKLLFSTSTDYNGVFKMKLPTFAAYEILIHFEGYKKKKVKNIFISQANLPLQTYSMDVRQKLTPLEVVAYALPLLDMLRILTQ